jgi:hypothetical protein
MNKRFIKISAFIPFICLRQYRTVRAANTGGTLVETAGTGVIYASDT